MVEPESEREREKKQHVQSAGEGKNIMSLEDKWMMFGRVQDRKRESFGRVTRALIVPWLKP